MIKKLFATVALLAPALLASYTYYYTDTLTTIDSSKWVQVGSVSATTSGLTATSTNGGSLISSVSVPGGGVYYEAKMTLALTASGGTYVTYLRASNDALSGPGAAGTFYAVEVQSPTFSGGVCTATLAIYKRVSGTVTSLSSNTISCHDGMTIRSVSVSGYIFAFTEDRHQYGAWDSSITSGMAGVGARGTPTGNSVSKIELGPHDTTAPSSPNIQSSQGVAPFPNRVEMQWAGVNDDSSGSGLWGYVIYRNSTYLGVAGGSAPNFVDTTVSAGTTYSYSIYASDYHNNYSSPATFNVTTPTTGTSDARRIGVRSTGAYWGAGGEQIDTLSGNLNYTLPILKAMGRGGWSVPFALSYNSQLWRKESNGEVWKLGADVGYGLGWQLMAGCLTPYYSDIWTVDHYVFTDSTGAQYRLGVNTSGVWSSQEGVYLYYDSATQRLYFPNGTYWVMDTISEGAENDAGTQYPSLMEDTNGNQIFIRYNTGNGGIDANSSARISEIEDVRAVSASPNYHTFSFGYTTVNGAPHLTAISNYISSSETHSFGYSTITTLLDPFTSSTSFPTTATLQTATLTSAAYQNAFTYNSSGEMTKVELPQGGYIRWAHRSFTYTGSRTLREVENRYLSKTGTGETTYALSRDDSGDASKAVHSKTCITDPSTGGGASARCWYFETSTSSWQLGLNTKIERRASTSGTIVRQEQFTWSQNSVSQPYVSEILTALDPGLSYEKQSKVTQTIDNYGNLTGTNLYDFGSGSTPASTAARIYANTYLTDSGYLARYILNRLVSSQVKNASASCSPPDGVNCIQLVTNYYDTYSGGYCSSFTQSLVSLPSSPTVHEHDTSNYGTGCGIL